MSATLWTSLSLIRTTDAVAVAIGLYLLRRLLHAIRTKGTLAALPLPPALPSLPLFGNVRDIPTGHAWLGYTAQHEALNRAPVTRLSALGTHIMICHDPKAAHELFEEKSAVFSDRPRVVFGGEMVGWEHTLALLRYGPRLKSYRRDMHQVSAVLS